MQQQGLVLFWIEMRRLKCSLLLPQLLILQHTAADLFLWCTLSLQPRGKLVTHHKLQQHVSQHYCLTTTLKPQLVHSNCSLTCLRMHRNSYFIVSYIFSQLPLQFFLFFKIVPVWYIVLQWSDCTVILIYISYLNLQPSLNCTPLFSHYFIFINGVFHLCCNAILSLIYIQSMYLCSYCIWVQHFYCERKIVLLPDSKVTQSHFKYCFEVLLYFMLYLFGSYSY